MVTVAVSPDIDESHWPVVVATMPRQSMTDSELLRFLDRETQYCQRGQPFVLIIDVRAAPHLAPPQRRLVAERIDQNAENYPYVMRGVGVVLTNTVQRGIVTVLAWLIKRPFEMKPFESVGLAVAWASRLLLTPPKTSKRPSLAHSENRPRR